MNPARALPVSEKLLYRPAEAAQLLSLGKTKIYELINTGALIAVPAYPNGPLRVSRASLERYVAALDPAPLTGKTEVRMRVGGDAA